MRFVGIDTSSSRASVAITDNGRIITETFGSATISPDGLRPRNNHAEAVLALLDSSLLAAGLSLADLSGFAVAIGPGSFTGLRVGLSTVKGLSYGAGTPLAGVSTLEALAARINDYDGSICAIMDARKRELYAAVFRGQHGLPQRVTEDCVMSFDQLVAVLRRLDCSGSIMLTGDGVAQYGDSLVGALNRQVFSREDENLPTIGAAVALLGEAALAAGPATPAAILTPVYLRRAEAEAKIKKSA